MYQLKQQLYSLCDTYYFFTKECKLLGYHYHIVLASVNLIINVIF